MKQHQLVDQQFGQAAKAYLSSTTHAQGQDLEALAALARTLPQAEVLDLGCGGGHVSFAMAPHVSRLTAFDLSEDMLAVVKAEALERGLDKLHARSGRAEQLPFGDQSFDLVATRFSAHHWADVPAALAEVRRVLRPAGQLVVIDVIAPEQPLFDTVLQSAELLRDASHVRDYRISEWLHMLATAGFDTSVRSQWRLPMAFDAWFARIRTPQLRADAVRDLFERAPEEARQYFAVQTGLSFEIDVAWFDATA